MSDNALVLADAPEVRFAVVNGVLFVAVGVGGAQTGVGTTPATGIALLLLGVTVVAGRLPVAWAGFTGLCSWGFVTGFVVNDFGQLSFAHADLVRMALFVVTAVVTAVLAASAVRHSQMRHGPPMRVNTTYRARQTMVPW